MLVDSYLFLPRSFRPLYDGLTPLPGEDEPVWAPFERRLADARIALLTSAGLSVVGEQEPFDGNRERAEPEWGDPTWRAIPAAAVTTPGTLGMMHLHVNNDDVLEDPNIALPAGALAELVDEGTVGAATDEHVSVMGYQRAGLDEWRTRTAPEIAARLRDHGADGVVLAPV
jgi:hypothetical protein